MANCSAAIDSDTSSSVSIVSKDASAATIASCKAANESEVYTPSSFDKLRALEINAFNSVRSTLGSSDSSFSTKLSMRSEEHTSELQSRGHIVCRLLLEKEKRQR